MSRRVGCHDSDAFLDDGTPLPYVGEIAHYSAFVVDEPDGTLIHAYCENESGTSETVPIVLPEYGDIFVPLALALIAWRFWR